MKKKSMNRKTCAIALLLFGILTMLAGIWMFYQSRGTGLLFLDAGIGRMCGFYWLFLLIALLLLISGIWILKKYPMTKDKKTLGSSIETEKASNSENTELELPEVSSDGRICPSCGKENKPESIFCIYCGSKFDGA